MATNQSVFETQLAASAIVWRKILVLGFFLKKLIEIASLIVITGNVAFLSGAVEETFNRTCNPKDGCQAPSWRRQAAA